MAKLVAPLFSFRAHGRLGTSLIYSSNRRTNYVKSYAVPSQPNTPKQQTVRLGTAAITKAWATLPASLKLEWQTVADELDLSPYHAYLKANCRAWADDTPFKMSPEPHIVPPASIDSYTVTQHWPTYRIQVQYETATPDPFFFQIAATTVWNVPPTKDRTILLLIGQPNGDYFWRIDYEWTPPYWGWWYMWSRLWLQNHTATPWTQINA